jgi:segregation and condensation protein B
MSLKAKLEAVIYAAEEPVTLTQLAALFAADALAWKAEQEAASAAEAAEAAQPDAQLNAEFDYLDPEALASMAGSASEAEEVAETFPNQDSASSLESSAETSLESTPEAATSAEASEGAVSSSLEDGMIAASEATAENPEAVESEIRRQARQRDREVRAILRQLLDEIIASCASDGRGVEIREIAGGYRMATKPECHDAVRLFVKSLKPALKLSLAALETLAVIAYKQPVTAPEVNEIRGVESAGVLGSLLTRKLIATAGRKQVIGRPILYKTTKEFLLRFGLKDVAELPSMEEFEKMAAIELEEPEAGGDSSAEATAVQGQKEAGWNDSLDSDSEDIETGEELPDDELNAGAVPASAETPSVQESEAAEVDVEIDAESGAEIDVEMPRPMPAVMAAGETAETPAETAAEDSAATEVPAEA